MMHCCPLLSAFDRFTKTNMTAATMSNTHLSQQTPSTRSVFDNEEDRQSLSSADVSVEGALKDATLEDTPLACARAAHQLYTTPQARSAISSIAALAKEKLEKVSPGRRSCIVTNEEFPRAAIEAAHLLPRATKHELVRLPFCVICCLIQLTLFS
jgi:hypothetical protein